MARYLSDQNKVVMIHESGTYGSVSGTGQWLGYVQSHDLDEEMGVKQIKFQGTGTRNNNLHVNGPIDNKGVLTYYPQDLRMLGFFLGSITDTSGTQSSHAMSEANNGAGNAYTSGTTAPFMSFTLEDSHASPGTGANFIRTINGCMIDEFSLDIKQGEIISAEISYVAQNVAYSSGATTAVTENTSLRPYLWSDVKVHIPSGTVYPEATSVKFSGKNGANAPHYINGSRVSYIPYMTSREYTVELENETDSSRLNTLYANYFKSGTEFNMMLELNASAGSQAEFIILSGCKLDPMKNPSPLEGIDTSSVTIIPKSCYACGSTLITRYNPW